MRRDRLRWHGHVERKDEADNVKACTRLVVEGKASVDRPRKTWQNTLSADMCLMKVNPRTFKTERNGMQRLEHGHKMEKNNKKKEEPVK